MKYVAVFLIAILVGSVALAQQQTGDDVVRVRANLVNIDVMVKDKKGKYIPDLKAEDFTIIENGVAQKIEFFDAPLSNTETKSAPAAAAAPDVATATTPPASVAHNYVALVLDSQTTD